jgi:hypothetical protein
MARRAPEDRRRSPRQRPRLEKKVVRAIAVVADGIGELKLLRKYKAWTTRYDVYLGGTVAICAPGADRSLVSRAHNSRAVG